MEKVYSILTIYFAVVSSNYFLVKVQLKQKKVISKDMLKFYTISMFIPFWNMVMLGNMVIEVIEEFVDIKIGKKKKKREKEKKVSFLQHFYGVEEKENQYMIKEKVKQEL